MKKTLQTFPKCHNFKQKKHSICANQVANCKLICPSANHAAHSGKTLRTAQTVLPGQPTQTKLHLQTEQHLPSKQH